MLGGRSGHRRYFRAQKSRWGGALQVCRHAWKEVDLATPPARSKGRVVTASDGEDGAKQIVDFLKERKFL